MKKIRLQMDGCPGYHCIKDEGYAQQIREVVEPCLNACRECGYYERQTGVPLYYEAYTVENPRGNVIIVHGFTENVEKYREVIYYFIKEKYQVYLMDHRGHGRSFREAGTSDCSLTHVENFEDYIEDLHGFIEEVVTERADLNVPFYLYAHSMGGAVAVRYLQMYPGRIEKAVLTAPMLGILLNMPESAAFLTAAVMKKCKKAYHYLPGHGPFTGTQSFRDSVSSSKERYEFFEEKRKSCPYYQNNGGSYGWMLEAEKMIRAIRREKRNIQIPICIFAAEKESLVTLKDQLALAERTPDSRVVMVSGSKHEIFMAPEAIQAQYWRYIFRFLEVS